MRREIHPAWIDLSGVIPVHKPRGMISKDVSRWLMDRVGRIHLGHVGTLDPAAEGVLPLVVGRASRLQDCLLEQPKAYEFEMTLGRETSSLDDDGDEVATAEWSQVTEQQLRDAALRFVGTMEQVPPMVSAIKINGKPLYEYVREGKPLPEGAEVAPRRVTIKSLQLNWFRPPVASFVVDCSRGTYVRSLARDIAYAAGTMATVTRLVRTVSAGIPLQSCWTLEQMEAAIDEPSRFVIPVEKLDCGLGRWKVRGEGDDRVRLSQGQTLVLSQDEFGLSVQNGVDDACVMLCEEDGRVFGLGLVRPHHRGGVELKMKRGLS